MGSRRLFHHPVGIFPLAARWYLAALAVLALVLAAVHFVIHVRAQENARQAVQAWMHEAGIQASKVRYHLLRNALSLDSVAIVRGRSALEIGQVLLHVDAARLTASQPRLGRVALTGVRGRWHAADGPEVWTEDPHLKRLWLAIERMRIRDGELELTLRDGAPPLVLEQISWSHEADRDGVHDRWEARIRDGFLLGEYHRQASESRGSVHWRGLDFGRTMQSLGREAPDALADGEMRFALSPEDSGLQPASWQAEARLRMPDGLEHRLTVKTEDKSRSLRLVAERWPLRPFRGDLPAFDGAAIASGMLSGRIRVDPGRPIRASADRLTLADAVLVAGPDTPVARLKQVELAGLRLDAGTQQIRLDQLQLEGGDAVIHPGADGESAGLMRRAGSPAWEIERIGMRDIALRLRLERGDIEIPAMSGSGRIDRAGAISLALEHPAEDESWNIKLSGSLRDAQWNHAEVEMHGERVPLQRLRAALPLTGGEHPLSLDGRAKLSMKAIWRDGGWDSSGSIDVSQAVIRRAGHQWAAEDVRLDFDMGRDMRRIRSLHARGWRYIAPLVPLPKAGPGQGVSEGDREAWWTTLLRQYNWGLEDIQLNQGQICLGRAEDVWVDGLSIRSAGISPGSFSPFQAEGRAGDGALSLRGQWNLLRSDPRLSLDAELREARPFFLNAWLAASGMPRLIRGRLSAELHLKDDGEDYRVSAALRLRRGLVENAAYPEDPLILRTGFSLRDILGRLQDASASVSVAFEMREAWQRHPPALAVIGAALESAVIARLRERPSDAVAPVSETPVAEARIRLHERASLSHNERARLRRLWRQMIRHRGWTLELRPIWTGDRLDQDMLDRIAYTQGLIEAFMRERGIGQARIFPIWPQAAEHGTDLGHVRAVLLRSPRAGGKN